ncbi:MAG TPA: Gfo/Idh/MocA family oxidoreductase, partial [Flavisolibacter sp.]|nr:Gfo/Idh/MocA family oxidoreductase [Flavisolibacter sp.]
MHRRKFIRDSSISALGATALTGIPFDMFAFNKKKIAPSDVINVALIGCKGMGWSNLKSMLKIPEVKCLALCDIDQNVLNERKAELNKIGIQPLLYSDYRNLLDNKDADAVIVATPDHWHCLQMIDSCAAGKDVYVEKPASNSISEAQLMVAAANRYNKIVQVNQWQRSQEHFQNAVAFVQSGKLGKINATKTWMFRGGTTHLPVLPNETVPPGVDYNMWLGPAPKVPFNKNRFHYE